MSANDGSGKEPLNPQVVAGIARELGVAGVIKAHGQFSGAPEYEAAFHHAGIFQDLDAMAMELESGSDMVLQKMLLRQAVATQAIFASLAQRAAANAGSKHHDTLMAMALKAQAASRATIAALGDLRNPRTTVFAKQVNAAAGHQQVNNGSAPGASTPATAEPPKPAAIEMADATPIGIVGTVGVRATRTREKSAAPQKRTIGARK